MTNPENNTEPVAAAAEASTSAEAPASTSASAPAAAPAVQSAERWTQLGMPEIDDGDSAIGSFVGSSTASISESILEYRSILGRTYHSDRKAGDNLYWAPNDEKAQDGLDIFHHALTLALDDELNKAPLPDDFDGKVLDIGTGTGIWAIDFADKFPGAQVTGTDLSPIQPQWVPPNCQFQVDDATAPWTFNDNEFDYVHMRWLLGAVTDWTALAKEVYRCLKPGAWFEWFELNAIFETDDDSMPPDSALAQWTPLFESAARMAGSQASFRVVSEGLQRQAMDAAGFVNYNEHNVKIPLSGWPGDRKFKEMGNYMHAALDADVEGYLNMSAAQHGWKPNEIVVYSAHVRKELREKKIHAFYRGRCAWAQKPLSA